MRILFLTSRLPFPPHRGDRLRTYHFLRVLGKEHEITLISFIQDEKERGSVVGIAPFCTAVHVLPWSPRRSALAALGNIWRRQPLQALYYRSGRMQLLVDSLLSTGTFDLAYAHLFRMAPYLQPWQGLYRVVDFTDLISGEIAASLPYRPPLWQAIYRLEQPRLAGYERRVAAWADEVWFISDRDRAAFATQSHHATLHVVPNVLNASGVPKRPRLSEGDILFVGNLDVPHNQDAVSFLVNEIMPQVWREVPGATVNIVGAGKGKGLKTLAQDPRVRISGFVPDLQQAYDRSLVFAAPLRFAAGTQNKVLEALAAGLPAVVSPAVHAGLDTAGERVVLVAEDTSDFARQLIRLLQDPDLRATLGAAGQRYIRTRYTEPGVAAHMRTLAQKLAK